MVLTVFRIQKMLVKDGELGYNMLVTVSDVPVHYKIKTFLFLNSLDWLGEKAIGFTPGQSLPLSVGSSDEWSLSGPWLINYPHAF